MRDRADALDAVLTVAMHSMSEAGLLAQVVRHARDDHGMEHVPHDVLDAVRAHIEDVA